tara:strand:+ start:202 stop:504 length:303 start_codon:yes stop_codon:yes gene_type:complete
MPKVIDYDVFKKIVLKAENDNEHGQAAEIVTSLFGTPEELKKIKQINKAHDKRGFITLEDSQERNSISSKYYRKLMNKSKMNNGTMKVDKLLKMEKKGLI